MWLLSSGKPLSARCCRKRRLCATRRLLLSTTSMSTKMLWPRPALENTLLDLDLIVRTQNDWKMAHECWGWRSRWNTVNCGGSEKAWFQTLPILSRDGQCSLYAEGLSGTFRCVVGWTDETKNNLLQRMISETGETIQLIGIGLLMDGNWTCGSMPAPSRSE